MHTSELQSGRIFFEARKYGTEVQNIVLKVFLLNTQVYLARKEVPKGGCQTLDLRLLKISFLKKKTQKKKTFPSKILFPKFNIIILKCKRTTQIKAQKQVFGVGQYTFEVQKLIWSKTNTFSNCKTAIYHAEV